MDQEINQKKIMTTKRVLCLSLLIISVVITLINSFVIVSAGERGVLLNWGAVSNTVFDEGLHFIIPIQQRVKIVDVKTTKYEVEVLAYSQDIQTVSSKIALNYHVDSARANILLQEIGKDFEERIVAPAIQEAVKATVANFKAQELIENRPKVKDEIKAQLSERLKERQLIVDEFSIINFDFSKLYEQAVEAKQKAQQDALKAENDLRRVKLEAEQRVAQATAEATAIRIQAEAITQQGGENYVRLKAIERWSGILPTQMIPNGALPFLNLNK